MLHVCIWVHNMCLHSMYVTCCCCSSCIIITVYLCPVGDLQVFFLFSFLFPLLLLLAVSLLGGTRKTEIPLREVGSHLDCPSERESFNLAHYVDVDHHTRKRRYKAHAGSKLASHDSMIILLLLLLILLFSRPTYRCA
jgi:hypothetical protein